MPLARALLRFSRPHTILATSTQVVGLYLITLSAVGALGRELDTLLVAWVAALAANLYIVGINQISDVPIDRVNKPALPLVSGELSVRQGWQIVLLTAALALLLGAVAGRYLLLTVAIGLFIGTIYSLPPRLKRFPFWAALSIAFVRGVVANVGFYWHYLEAAGAMAGPLQPPVTWMVPLFFAFGLVIALYKDIPDRQGDQAFTIRTYTVRWGPQRVFNLGRLLMTALYLIPISVGLARGPAGLPLVIPHLAVLLFFWWLSLRVDPAGPDMPRFYLGLWGLFYAEYILLSAQALSG